MILNKSRIVKFKTLILKIIDILISPFIFISSFMLRYVRNKGVDRFTVSRAIFRRLGIAAVTDHYYEPLYNPKPLKEHKRGARELDSINLEVNKQINFLSNLDYWNEVSMLIEGGLLDGDDTKEKYAWLQPAECEVYYSIIRRVKPVRIIEIGGGVSSLVALEGVKKNFENDNDYRCNIYCIEPYENKWLENTGVNVIRKKVEEIEIDFFKKLKGGDILFIDSSHIIKPNGDVLYEYLEILPALNYGVLVHIHDIFTPFDYPDRWIIDRMSFWNEQYLLEAFLSYNKEFEILAALRYLMWKVPEQLKDCLKSLHKWPRQEPSSFWIRKGGNKSY